MIVITIILWQLQLRENANIFICYKYKIVVAENSVTKVHNQTTVCDITDSGIQIVIFLYFTFMDIFEKVLSFHLGFDRKSYNYIAIKE